MHRKTDLLTIGQLAERSGLAPSALRFYESLDLISSSRTAGGRRRYQRSTLRRIAVVQAAQRVGLTLAEVGAAFADLSSDAAPTRREWERLSSRWQAALDARIEALEKVRDELANCIGCGCLSLRRCSLYNSGDRAARRGVGPRWLLGDDPAVPVAPDGDRR
ncbi:MAG: redox-sensitive transcriptional activator SoxR [Geodermatophilaceae bacterium]|nr:redox-sensitive transcriptional activator SoxR [Geodermatophilaceae bacterium]MDQ3454569.1 redox-sensitive transcriptional activator SoxR [Actinomycetota bacterium]